MQEFKRRSLGFTQIELVTTLTVMSVLSAVALPRLMDFRTEAKHVSLQALASTLTQTSAFNAAQGQLRANADIVSQCQDVGRFVVNASKTDKLMAWQGRALEVSDSSTPAPFQGNLYRECTLRDIEDAQVSPVRFFIRLCNNQRCAQA